MPRKNRPRARRPIGRDRTITVRSARREQPNLSKIAQAVVGLVMAQAEADAQAAKPAENPTNRTDSNRDAVVPSDEATW